MRIGIDLGGTKIEGVILDSRGAELRRVRAPTPPYDYAAVLDAIADVIAQLEAALPADARGRTATVGVATPGVLSPRHGVIRNSNLGTLNDRPIHHDLARRLGRPVRVENDANCFVLSEATDGAAAPTPSERTASRPPLAASHDVVFGATLGTGVGGGLVIDGRVWGGANGSAGEWSHTSLPFWRSEDGSGAACTCGHHACIESFLSGRGLTWQFERLTGKRVGPVEIASLAGHAEPRAVAAFENYEDHLARALAAVINLIDPRTIVLGGGISNNLRLFENVPKLWERYTVAKDVATRLERAIHGDASGVRGAAWLWPLDTGDDTGFRR